jgi:hypothetical protein
VCGYIADKDVGSFSRVYVTSGPNKDEFEPTGSPSVSDMACMGSCPTLLVEGEPHQHINPSVKYISPWVNPFTRSEDESVSGVRASACFTQHASRTEPYLKLGHYTSAV